MKVTKKSLKSSIKVLESYIIRTGGSKIKSEKIKVYCIYKLRENIFISFSFNEEEKYFDIRLGDLYLYNNEVFVLEELDWLLYHLDEVDNSKNYLMLSYENDIEWYTNAIIKELNFIINNIDRLKELSINDINERKNKYGDSLQNITSTYKDVL